LVKTRFGLSVALATAVDENDAIAIDAMIKHARHCLDAGCASVTLFGTTGEGCSVCAAERESVLNALLEAGIDSRQIVMGVLVDAVEDAASQARLALEKGVRNVLLAPPSYFKGVSDDGVFNWFASVFRILGPAARDIIVYNLPSVTMVPLSLELVGRLRTAFPDIVVGVKDSSGDWSYTERLLAANRDLIILIGDERHLAKSVRLGGQGAISGMANFLPAEVRAMAVDGQDDGRAERLVDELLKYPVVPAVKALVARSTGDGRWLAPRAPLVALRPEECSALESAFSALFQSKAGGYGRQHGTNDASGKGV
jgi:4-hydroxy-tetrahydrodipicolinate synthase